MTLVLIVDDSPIDRLLAGRLLQKQMQCDVAYAENGAAGLRSIRELNPDLILTDMQMPVLDGLEMVRTVRQESVQTPIILMTAVGSEDLAVEALRLGASSYVPKSSLARRLVETVQVVLSIADESCEQPQSVERIQSFSETFRLHNSIEECRSLSRYLQSTWARIWNRNTTSRVRVGLAVEEALRNGLYHGNLEIGSSLKNLSDNEFYDLANRRLRELPYSDRRIEVQFLISPEESRFVIRDGGQGFNVAGLPDPTDSKNITRPFGRGLMLMQTFMDEVHFNDRGSEVTLIKNRSRPL